MLVVASQALQILTNKDFRNRKHNLLPALPEDRKIGYKNN